ncbi:MAG TPA: hypothetical protein VIH05_08105 [Tepidiformaceae bacterium]
MAQRGMRRFVVLRNEDPGGVSGTGQVAEGVEFSDGTCVLRWTTVQKSTAFYDSAEACEAIHGHSGMTRFEWID